MRLCWRGPLVWASRCVAQQACSKLHCSNAASMRTRLCTGLLRPRTVRPGVLVLAGSGLMALSICAQVSSAEVAQAVASTLAEQRDAILASRCAPGHAAVPSALGLSAGHAAGRASRADSAHVQP